ncbi:hypothetical protein OH76DRAFT_650752 [Lentinus brumalis]|uniref:Asl1-like glycosyl hydrolase catalytic domain-containing protein n=1 Tax=Lentinus brumalis TaxID=2498619 RepID=A0A371D843_9APHY|nr:hypothetical protein OH76DRAFT_650752 [Polyporus brumalis]
MLVGSAQAQWDDEIVGIFQALDVKYVLGFNEPDNVAQSNLSPAEAAALWQQHIQPLKRSRPAASFGSSPTAFTVSATFPNGTMPKHHSSIPSNTFFLSLRASLRPECLSQTLQPSEGLASLAIQAFQRRPTYTDALQL